MSGEWRELEGTVCSGLGEGAEFTQLDWVLMEFRNKLGFEICPGTFNLSLMGTRWVEARQTLMGLQGIKITPPEGFCGAKCFAVELGGMVKGYVIFPEVDDYPEDKLEILAPVSVRKALAVGDGDRLKIRLHIQ